jgi:hypothetical protein
MDGYIDTEKLTMINDPLCFANFYKGYRPGLIKSKVIS